MTKRVSTIVTEFILTNIKEGNYNIGDKLPSERELMELLEVGRSSVRESLNTLEDMNILEKRMGIGVFVKQTQVHNLVDTNVVSALLDEKVSKDLLDFRLMIEVGACARTALIATEEDLLKMEKAIKMHKEIIHQNGSSLESDLLFHQSIVEGASNNVLKNVYESISDLLISVRKELLKSEDKEKSLRYHEKIYYAIKIKDSEMAGKLMREHLLDVATDYDELIKMDKER
ncbi:FadR/GntR family transcriptional regulator [Neobacillus vireti]|uniref:Transcriptional regulator n=1 Tax=Neobacillus vireti LMG 21834 TaxID=1131730 RepID=A0AB94IFI1_9BACI|nr:FadR/GntR family transcriptional regulator [Neobacillus vireti]ETI65869.1 transcriptional regulator [Neobacillus vireti LMG 21834]KLT17494.1 transcriptional regulator [Neobacillus vireti]